MTWSTSEVAVCCSSDSVSSLSSRAFSMAMTAWSAKLVTSSICLSVEGPNFLAVNGDDADHVVFLEHRHPDQSAGLRNLDRRDTHSHA